MSKTEAQNLNPDSDQRKDPTADERDLYMDLNISEQDPPKDLTAERERERKSKLEKERERVGEGGGEFS